MPDLHIVPPDVSFDVALRDEKSPIVQHQGSPLMHPMSFAVAAMAADISAVARRTNRTPIDPIALELYTHHTMHELVRTRPRVTQYLPELALNQVLAFLGMRERSVVNQEAIR